MAKERPLTPTNRTIECLAELGWLAGDVERRVTSHLTMDLFEIFDVVAVKAGEPTRGIQCTSNSGGNHSARVKRLKANENTKRCLDAGWLCEVWSWKINKNDDGWNLRITVLGPETWGAEE